MNTDENSQDLFMSLESQILQKELELFQAMGTNTDNLVADPTESKKQMPSDMADVERFCQAAMQELDQKPQKTTAGNHKRMLLFFKSSEPAIQHYYQELKSHCEKERQQERLFEKLSYEFNMLKADKGDDVQAMEEGLSVREKRLYQRHHQRENLLQTIKEHHLKMQSSWQTFLTFIFRRKNKIERIRQEWDAELAELDREITLKTSERDHYLANLEAIRVPIRNLEQKVARIEEEKLKQNVTIEALNRKIDDHILGIIARASPEQLESLMMDLDPMVNDSLFFRYCTGQLRELMGSEKWLLLNVSEANRFQEDFETRARESLSGLCSSIQEHFVMDTRSDVTTFKMRGEVKVSGYARGTASGEGSGQAYYQVTEPRWISGRGFDDAAEGFSKCWSQLGAAQNRVTHLKAQLQRHKTHIKDIIHFIRAELERDFHAGAAS